jgi:tRNA nucleotidyltransferase (CCA-adding enzyme)
MKKAKSKTKKRTVRKTQVKPKKNKKKKVVSKIKQVKKTTKRVKTLKPTKSTQSVLNAVLKEIMPDEGEVHARVEKFITKLNKILQKQKINAIAVAGGSIAKGTFLKQDHDCDVFVKFDYFYHAQDISTLLKQALKKAKLDVETLHGSRDYFRHTESGLGYEIVPVLDIYLPKDAVNITDCSPLHASWVQKQTNKKKGLKDEIRLAKSFCKGIGVYGAESYIKGFSGHVIDILTLYYDGFLNLLKESQKWKEKKVIDFNKVYKGKALMRMNASKIQSALIVVDPIQPERNASAVLSAEKMKCFKDYAKKFLKHPSQDFFVKKSIDVEELKERYGKNTLVIVYAVPLKGKTDVVGAKLMKVHEFLVRSLADHDFELQKTEWEWNPTSKAIFYFVLDKKPLKEYKILKGPPLKLKPFAKAFKKKHKEVREKEGILYAQVEREHTLPGSLIEKLLQEEYVHDRVKKTTIFIN